MSTPDECLSCGEKKLPEELEGVVNDIVNTKSVPVTLHFSPTRESTQSGANSASQRIWASMSAQYAASGRSSTNL